MRLAFEKPTTLGAQPRTHPAGKLKSMLDCVEGYYKVEVAEEDRHKTTFVKEDTKFRCRRIPQGYGLSDNP